MTDLMKRLAALSPEKRALVLKKLKEQGHLQEEKPAWPDIPTGSHEELAPLSFSQLRIWMMIELSGRTDLSANMEVSLRIKGALNHDALLRAKNDLMSRHDALRTRFTIGGEETNQSAIADTEMPFGEMDLRHLQTDEREERAKSIIRTEYKSFFDPVEGPMIRATLIRLDEEEFVLSFVMNHLVSDGWSVGVLTRDFVQLYTAHNQGRAPMMQPLPIRYADYARWQRQRLTGETLEKHTDFWKSHLEGSEKLPALPADRPVATALPAARAQITFTMDKDLLTACRKLATDTKSSLYMVLLAGLQTQLYRYSGQQAISVGSLISGRNHPQTEQLVGLFINTIVFRSSLAGNPIFSDQMARTKKDTLAAYDHQDLPYEKVIAALNTQQRGKAPALFRAMLVLQNMPGAKQTISGLTVSPFTVFDEKGFSTADLTYQLFESDEGITGALEYNTAIFNAETVDHMARQYKTLLADATANPSRHLDDLQLSGSNEQVWLQDTFNATQSNYDCDVTISALIEAKAKQTPQALALFHEGETISYAQLETEVNQLAHYLIQQGLAPGDLAAVSIHRSPRMIIALLAILKAGGAYLPLDPANPPERLSFMLQDSGCHLVLVEQATTALFNPEQAKKLELDDSELKTALTAMPHHPPTTAVSPDHPAYVIYTSGSTGTPKGVVIPQRALVQYTHTAVDLFDITANDRILQFASISFDTAAEEIFPCLASGACLVLRNDDMMHSAQRFSATCAEWGVTLLDLPTAWWHAMVDQIDSLELASCLRLIIIGGEKADPERVHLWREQIQKPIRLFNTYGPTETTIVATSCELSAYTAHQDQAPIGHPVADTSAYVLDHKAQALPHAASGELCLGGLGLAQGYLGRPALTAERFIPNPYSNQSGARLYRTGDLVRLQPEGPMDASLQYLGRIDHQVKIRGFRIELGEIETALRKLDPVEEAVVIAQQDSEDGAARLIAYVTGDCESDDLKAGLRDALPDYMIPALFITLDQMPLTTSGKIDRAALPAPEADGDEDEYIAPESEVEIACAEIWSDLLKVERIGLLDNFFDLGGNSLMTGQVLYRIKKKFEVDISLHDFFEDPTLGNIAILVEEILLDDLEDEEELLD